MHLLNTLPLIRSSRLHQQLRATTQILVIEASLSQHESFPRKCRRHQKRHYDRPHDFAYLAFCRRNSSSCWCRFWKSQHFSAQCAAVREQFGILWSKRNEQHFSYQALRSSYQQVLSQFSLISLPSSSAEMAWVINSSITSMLHATVGEDLTPVSFVPLPA